MTKLPLDEALQAEVMTALRLDETLPTAHIGVIATDGAVTLTGEVATEHQRFAASTLVQNVAGVRAVADELVVRPPGSRMRTETAVAVDVARAVDASAADGADIAIEVAEHIVFLDGRVARHGDLVAAEQAALDVPGVLNVINRLRIEPVAALGDVQAAMVEAFVAFAKEHASGVNVSIDEGHVELHGSVRTLAERQVAEQAAWTTPGVRSVKNRLHIHT